MANKSIMIYNYIKTRKTYKSAQSVSKYSCARNYMSDNSNKLT